MKNICEGSRSHKRRAEPSISQENIRERCCQIPYDEGARKRLGLSLRHPSNNSQQLTRTVLSAHEAIWKLLSLFEVASANRIVLAAAVESSMGDFEDAVLAQSANHSGVERIVTRNTSDLS